MATPLVSASPIDRVTLNPQKAALQPIPLGATTILTLTAGINRQRGGRNRPILNGDHGWNLTTDTRISSSIGSGAVRHQPLPISTLRLAAADGR